MKIESRNWWLRSPNTGNSNNVRNVNTSGALNNNNANNSNGLVPDCASTGEYKVSRSIKAPSEIKAFCARNPHLDLFCKKNGRMAIVDTALLTASNWSYTRHD